MNEEWLRDSEEWLNTLTDLKVGDRLHNYVGIIHTLNSIKRCVIGWETFTQRPGMMAKFTDEDLKEFMEKLKVQSIELIHLDLDSAMKFPDLPKVEEKQEPRYS